MSLPNRDLVRREDSDGLASPGPLGSGTARVGEPLGRRVLWASCKRGPGQGARAQLQDGTGAMLETSRDCTQAHWVEGVGGWGLGSQRSVFGSQHPPRSGLSSLSATPCPPWGWPEDTRQGQEDACPPTGQRLPPLLLLFPPHSDETGENRASQPPGRGSDPASTTDRLHTPGQPMPKRCTRGAARIQGEQPHSRGPGPASRSCCLLAPF